jgi:predicted transcriptional regulator
MANKKQIRLGDLQLRIMQVLWQSTVPVGVAQVQQRLEGSPLAYTTVATMLRKMEVRGLVSHREDGRKYLYSPIATPDQVSRGISDDLVDRLFAGSLADTVSHLLETREVQADELDDLERLIRHHKQQR